MKLTSAALALLFAAPAFAANTLIDFEGVTSFESVAQYYNGASDSSGSNVGPAWGVTFGDGAIALANDVLGPYFSNAPSPMKVMAPVGGDSTMNVASGFVDSISFYYSADSVLIGAVNVWSGLNGAGTLLASFNLVGNAQSGGCSDAPFCRFDQLSSSFAGTAYSVTFGGAAMHAAIDDISITAVPEPASALLMALGVGGLLCARRRRS